MIKNTVICDRCGNECVGTYYTVDIYAHDVNPTKDGNGRVCSATALQNLATAMSTLNGKRHYCSRCIEVFQKTIYRGNQG